MSSLPLTEMGQFVLQKRKECGHTQQQLADLLGVTQPTVSAWERGQSRPEPAMTMKLAAALGVQPADTVDRFFGLRTEVERAIADDPLLDQKGKDAMLAVYSALTGRILMTKWNGLAEQVDAWSDPGAVEIPA